MSFSDCVEPSSLYIHWPFCPYKCHYCDFVALASHEQYMDEYHLALKKEMERFFDRYQKPLSIQTLYFGGGTPSTYSNELLLDTFVTLDNRVSFQEDAEITIEVNPGTMNEEQLDLWKNVGINRISIGVQSLNSVVLQRLNRHQKTKDVYWAIDELCKRFDNCSIDLILGLPGISVEQWKETVNTVVQWPISHISMYFLMIHENTPLYFKIKKNTITLPCDDEVVDLYYWTCDQFKVHGFEQYEISSFARQGKYSRHNKVYWQHVPYKGFGLGACSFDGMTRSQNTKTLLTYLKGVGNHEDVTEFCETLTSEQRFVETVMLQLRQTGGARIADLLAAAPSECKAAFTNKLDQFVARKALVRKDDHIMLSPRALALENEIITHLVSDF